MVWSASYWFLSVVWSTSYWSLSLWCGLRPTVSLWPLFWSASYWSLSLSSGLRPTGLSLSGLRPTVSLSLSLSGPVYVPLFSLSLVRSESYYSLYLSGPVWVLLVFSPWSGLRPTGTCVAFAGRQIPWLFGHKLHFVSSKEVCLICSDLFDSWWFHFWLVFPTTHQLTGPVCV